MKLRLNNIDLSIGKKEILKNISMEINSGEFTSVLGPSGCGKSTLLKCIAGILEINSGEILINDINIEKKPVYKRNTVIVFQDIRLFPHMSMYDNIAFPLKMKNIDKDEIDFIVKDLIKRIKLEGLEYRKPLELSGGQQQRVALARALASKPEILLLDEPFSGLDENLRFDMQLLIMDLHNEYNMTTIMVTHDKNEAISISDRIMVMGNGKILQEGKPLEVYNNPIDIEVAKYFGNSAFINGKVENNIFKSEELSLELNSEDGEYILVLRNNAFDLIKGKDFIVKYILNTNKGRELILKHIKTDIQIKYIDSTETILEGQSFDILPMEEKIILIKI